VCVCVCVCVSSVCNTYLHLLLTPPAHTSYPLLDYSGWFNDNADHGLKRKKKEITFLRGLALGTGNLTALHELWARSHPVPLLENGHIDALGRALIMKLDCTC
jgi:hypothetical protein